MQVSMSTSGSHRTQSTQFPTRMSERKLDVMARTSPSLKVVITVLALLFVSAALAQNSNSTNAAAQSLLRRSGKLELFYVDRADSATLHAFLNTGLARIPLHFKGTPENLHHGDQVTVEGTFEAADGGINATSISTTTMASTGVYGVQSTLVMLITLSDVNTTSNTLAAANTAYFSNLENWYNEVSFVGVSFSGQSVGIYPIAAASTNCDYNTYYSQALSAAQAAGINTGAYMHHVVVFPSYISTCGWSGLSTVGGSPSYSFINGNMSLYVTVHEMGHSLGLYHAHSLGCGSVPLLSDPTQCTMYEYGDSQDVMGVNAGQFGAAHKEQLGWLNASGYPAITTVSGGGTFIIGAYELQDSNVKALKIPRSSAGDYFYVEYRTQTGQDASYPAGLLIRLNGGSVSKNYLLDMTPTSPTTFSNSVLPVGATFTDPLTGITIQAVTEDGTAATVAVNGATTSTPPPSITISDSLSATPTTCTSRTTMYMTSSIVNSSGATVSGASVTVTITRADGSTAKVSGTTGTNGTVTLTYKFRQKDPKGTYTLLSNAAVSGLSATSNSVYITKQ